MTAPNALAYAEFALAAVWFITGNRDARTHDRRTRADDRENFKRRVLRASGASLRVDSAV